MSKLYELFIFIYIFYMIPAPKRLHAQNSSAAFSIQTHRFEELGCTVCLCGPLLFLWIVCQQDREMQRSFQNEVDMECYPPTESRIVSCSFVTSTMICPWNVTRNGSSLGRLSCFQQLIFIWYQSSSWSLQEGHPPSDVNHLLLVRVCYTVCIERGYYSAGNLLGILYLCPVGHVALCGHHYL